MSGSPLGARRAALLAALPDDALHVEVRGLLLGRPNAIVIGGAGLQPGGFVFAPEHGIAVGFGRPGTVLADELRDVADEHGMTQEGLELHLPMAAAGEWIARPDARLLVEHRVQALATADQLPHGWETFLQYENVVLESRADERLETLPRALRAEFAAMEPWPVVTACLAGGSIASIASAFVETEGYFDVSIDTVPDFRRAGFGACCAVGLMQHQAQRGKSPVWMARAKNRASLALSEKLGFADVGRVVSVELS